ncbi:MAG: recombinase family protein [Candidatus Bathyarchaeia archaeon]
MKDEKSNRNQPLFAAIYARTSSPNQKNNYSVKEQVSSCLEFCTKRGWIVRYIFVDEGESGKTVERPKFQQMLEKAKEGAFKVIVFWKLDRFCRSLVDLVNIEKMLRTWNIGLCSVTEFIDTTTSVGRFNFRNLASVAELERELIGERAKLGLYALVKEHKWPNPHPPIGYDKSESGHLVVNVTEAKLVNRIFFMYKRLKSMPQVAFELNKEGIRTKKGKEWNARAVKDVITNELYIGKFNVSGVKDYVPEYHIVEEKVFRSVNKIRLRYRNGHAKRPPMPKDRRKSKIAKIFDRYMKFIEKHEAYSSKSIREREQTNGFQNIHF